MGQIVDSLSTEAIATQIAKKEPLDSVQDGLSSLNTCKILLLLLNAFDNVVLTSVKKSLTRIDETLLHRAFYIPRSILHMPNKSDEDSSTAYNRFEQITRATTGTHCLHLSS